MKKSTLRYLHIAIASVVVLATTGCGPVDWVKRKFSSGSCPVGGDLTKVSDQGEAAGAVVFYVSGKPAMYQNEFETAVDQLLQAQYPQFRGMIKASSLPPSAKRQFLDEFIGRKLILAWGEKNNVESWEEYKKDLKETQKWMREQLMLKHFQESLLKTIEASDADVRAEYDKNRTRYAKVRGGVLVSGVSFETKADAQEFTTKAKGKKEEFKAIAAEEKKGKFRNFNWVSEESTAPMVPDAVKAAALKAAVPSVFAADDGKVFWVLCAEDKRKTEFESFDDVKGVIEESIRKQKFQEVLNKKLEALRAEFPVKVAEELFKPEKEEAPAPSVSPEAAPAEKKSGEEAKTVATTA